MPTGNHMKLVAACSGLCGFVIAIIAGLAVENPLDVILTRALTALVACNVLGMAVGAAAEYAFESRLTELQDAERAKAAMAKAAVLAQGGAPAQAGT